MHNHEHVENHEFNFNQITENIYIGNNQCCIMSLNQVLKDNHIYADISLEEVSIDTPYGVAAYLWVPVNDHELPAQEQFTLLDHFIENIIAQNKKVYVHCKNGHGRAPSVVIHYLIKKCGYSFEDALALVKEKLPVMHLSEAQQAYFNALV